MLFIDLCNQREERHLLEGILVFAWRDIRYRNVTLNDIGDLCYHKAEFDDSDFAKKYHEKVALKFERSEKEQADS